MGNVLVSVVVPTYDRAGFVETAIRSLLEQDYEALEVIAIDDGSRDDTPLLLSRIAERADPARFRWLRQDNVGQPASINRGLELARGGLLGYLSSDDYLLPGAISRLVSGAEEHPEVDVIYPWFEVRDVRDQVLDTHGSLQHTYVDALRLAICIPGVGALVRRSWYERVGGWDPSYRFAPDYEWWLRDRDALFLGIPVALGVFRQHDGSTTAGPFELEKIRERIRILDDIYCAGDLPAEVLAVKLEAYSAVLAVGASSLENAGAAASDRRFVIEDRLLPVYSRTGRAIDKESRLDLLRSLRSAESQLANAMEVVSQLEQTVAVLEDAARRRELRISQLEAELDHPHAEMATPGMS